MKNKRQYQFSFFSACKFKQTFEHFKHVVYPPFRRVHQYELPIIYDTVNRFPRVLHAVLGLLSFLDSLR